MILGVCGFIGSGKNTVADIVESEFGYEKESFAKTLKDVTSTVFGWPRELLEGDTDKSREFRDNVDTHWTEALGFVVTPRKMLQLMGTEIFRQNLHPNIWALVLEKRYLNNQRNIIITDVRFKNEIEFITKNGGYIIEVIRGDVPSYYTEIRESWNTSVKDDNTKFEIEKFMMVAYPEVHPSEYEWVGFTPPDRTWKIINDKSLSSLHLEVKVCIECLEKGTFK